MKHMKFSALISLGGLIPVLLMLLWVPVVDAQCGSEASSCKNCHEVQEQARVNQDGTAWHESHAFGDFCYICHAGNQQATEIDAAHLGMVPPLSDIRASCQSCHPNDLTERADVYAVALGVDLGGGTDSEVLATLATTPIGENMPTAEPVTAPTGESSDQSAACPPDTQLAVDDPNLVDYVKHYNQTVLGEQPVNWGNIALAGMIGILTLGGGAFVVYNEVRLNKSSKQTERIEGEYPADVVELLPALTNLKSQSRKSLKKLLNHPDKSDKVLGLIDAVVDDDQPEG